MVFEPDKWLQLGIAGGALFILLLVVVLFIRALNSTAAQWSGTVDKIAERQDETQRETNTILRDLSAVMNRIEVKVDDRGKAA